MKNFRVTALVAAILTATAGPVWADSLEIPGLAGDASGAGSIEIQSFSWGVTKTGSAQAQSRLGGAGKANVQDLSATEAAAASGQAGAASGQASGQASGKVAVQDISMTKRAAAGAPAAGSTSEIRFVVDPSAGPAAAALVSGCAKGKHFDTVVLTVNGKRQQLSDATFTCTEPDPALAAKTKQREFKGHVTLMK